MQDREYRIEDGRSSINGRYICSLHSWPPCSNSKGDWLEKAPMTQHAEKIPNMTRHSGEQVMLSHTHLISPLWSWGGWTGQLIEWEGNTKSREEYPGTNEKRYTCHQVQEGTCEPGLMSNRWMEVGRLQKDRPWSWLWWESVCLRTPWQLHEWNQLNDSLK